MHHVAVYVHGGAEFGHPQGGAQFVHVHVAWFEDVVHIFNGVLNRGSGEQLLLAEHVDHSLSDDVTHRSNALLHQRHYLTVHVLRLDVAHKVPIGHSIVGDAANVDLFGNLPFLVKDQVSKQRPTNWITHLVPPSSGALKS